MTPLLGLLLSVSLLSSPRMNSGNENKVSVAPIERIATAEETFTVQNSTPVNVGTITIGEADMGTAYVNVPGPGTFSTSLTATAVSCVINGQPCLQGQPTWIKIDAHTAVRATWTTNIVVVDQSEGI